MNITFRNIEKRDNKQLAVIVRDALAEFGADKPGTVYFDPTTDALYELFQKKGAAYIVALAGNELAGGCGIYPTKGLPADTCELVKMYLKPEMRGKGTGRKLVAMSELKASELGYQYIYLETLPELNKAVKLYEKLGYEHLSGPMGNSGHFGCNIWMIKKLSPDEVMENWPL